MSQEGGLSSGFDTLSMRTSEIGRLLGLILGLSPETAPGWPPSIPRVEGLQCMI